MNNKYLSAFEYIGSRITNFRIKNDFIDLIDSEKVKKSIDVSHEILNVETFNEGKTFSGVINVNIKVSEKIDKHKYNVTMSIEGCFTAPVKIGEDVFKKMLQINGITSLYSIARGFIQSTTSQTLMSGNILLPMFNVAEYSKDLNDNNDEEQTEGDE